MWVNDTRMQDQRPTTTGATRAAPVTILKNSHQWPVSFVAGLTVRSGRTVLASSFLFIAFRTARRR